MPNQPSAKDAEVFIRFEQRNKTFEAKLGSEQAPTLTIPEDAVDAIAEQMTPEMAEVFLFLIRESQKDADGKWVSASSKPSQKGQALVGEGKA